MLKQLSKNVTDSMCSAQVAVDLPNIVKELLENSLDAQAKTDNRANSKTVSKRLRPTPWTSVLACTVSSVSFVLVLPTV